MGLVVLISSFSNNNVSGCMESLITNPFIKLSLVYFSVYSIISNHPNSLLISLLILA